MLTENFIYNYWNREYNVLIWFLFISFMLTIILMIIAANLKAKTSSADESSQYECGFESYGSSFEFDTQYFFVALLFLVFDAELAVFIPWLQFIDFISFEGNMTMIGFLLLLLLGFFYEWKRGILHWT